MTYNNISDRLLERFLLEELPAQQMKSLNTRIKADNMLTDRLNALKASNREILTQFPPQVMAEQISSRMQANRYNNQHNSQLEKRRPFFFNKLTVSTVRLAVIPAMLAVVLLLFVLNPRHQNTPGPDDVNSLLMTGNRIKGDEAPDLNRLNLLVYRQRGTGHEQLKPGASAAAGDSLQLRYSVPEKLYCTIFSIDGNGVVTLHYPDRRSAPTVTDARRLITLESAYKLDDAPSFERFFLVASATPIDTAAVLTAAGNLAKDNQQARSAMPTYSNTHNDQHPVEISRQTSILILKGENR